MPPLEIFKQLFFIGSLQHLWIQFFFFLLKMRGIITCQFSITVCIPTNKLGPSLASFRRGKIGQGNSLLLKIVGLEDFSALFISFSINSY